MSDKQLEIFKQFTFDAAHFLPNVPDGHKCKEIHGHTYQLTLFFKGPLDETMGWIIDFNEIKKTVSPILLLLDHKYLNKVDGLENPTCEKMCEWLWEKIKPQLSQLSKIELKETPTSGAVYCGEQ
ncbi:MAG: 6-carboxytetrahydropterin synthase QueD [Bacteroidia bacterium]